MEDYDKYPEHRGSNAAGIRIFLQIRCTVGVSLRCGDVGSYSLHETGPGEFPIPCGAATDGEADTAEVGREIGVHLIGGRERGGGV